MDPAPTKRPMLSLRGKLAFATTAVLVVVSALLFGELTRRERQSLVAAKAMAASMVADLFAESLEAALDFDDADAVATELHHLETNPEVLCAAVFSRAGAPTGFDRGCNAAIEPVTLATSQTFDDRVVVTRIVRGRNRVVVGGSRVAFSLARENAAYASSRTRIFWLSVLLAIGTAALLLAVVQTQIVRPLRRLTEGARRVGGGDFDGRVDVRSSDELGELATAFNRMSAEIGDREKRLEAVTRDLRDLFDHMGQAIIAFDREGKVRGEVSREALHVFAADGLEGRPVDELLYGASNIDVEAQAFSEWKELVFEESAPWSEIAALAPREVSTRGIPLELEFRPVTKDGVLARVMVLATDVSEKKRLEQAIDTAEAEHRRRITAMRRLVAGGTQLFVDFLASTEARLAATSDDLDEVFRHVHTAKGEARAFELRDLEAVLEDVEGALSARDSARVSTGLELVRDALSRAREDFVAVSPIGRAALDLVTVRRADLADVLAHASGRDPALDEAVSRLASRPFGEATARVAERAPEWARKEAKRVEVVVEGREVPVPPRLAAVLPGVLAHLVRNAIAHGIESEADRRAAGKERAGAVWIAASADAITVEDDGAGIDVDAVRGRARALGLEEDDPHELVFHPGLSATLANDGLSGRGVGLDAVRVYLREVGYDVAIVSEPGRGTKLTITKRA